MFNICLGLNGWAAGKNDMGIYEYEYSIEKILDSAVDDGYDGIELANISPDPYPENLRDIIKISEFREKYNSRNLRIAGIQALTPRTGASENEQERDEFASRLLDNVVFAKILEADFVGVWPAPRQPTLNDHIVSQRLIDSFKKFFTKLEENKIDLGEMNIVVETEPVESLYNLTIAETVLEGANSPNLKLLFDFAHINVLTGSKLLRALKQFKGKIGHIHLTDNDGTRWASSKEGMSSKHLMIGEGDLNIKEILKSLIENQYKGWIQIDVWQNPYPFQCSKVNKIVVDNILKNIGREVEK